MLHMKMHLRRLLALTLCLLMAAFPALGEGLRFDITADLDAALYPREMRSVLQGVSALLDALSLSGTLTTHDGSFDLNADVTLGSGSAACTTSLQVFGMASHSGVRSNLLGEQELMVNHLSLLPFGLKAREWFGVPLEKAALLVPFVHEDALQCTQDVIAPFFPAQNGISLITSDDIRTRAQTLLRLCDEDESLYNWLDATELYSTAKYYLRLLISASDYIVPGLTVTKTDNTLSWDILFLNVLKLSEKDNTLSLSVNVPALLTINGTLRDDKQFVTGALHVGLQDDLSADLSFSLPTVLPCLLPAFYLTLDATGKGLPDDGLHLVFDGEARGNTLLIRQLLPDHSHPLLTITATLTPFTPSKLPSYTPSDLNGLNILSVNSDSLITLLRDVRQPLLTGAYDLLVAAPPQAVQTLMDVLEDTGILGLLTDSLSGGSGY